MCLQYKFSLEITVLSSCSEGGEKQNKTKNATQSKQSQSSLAGEAAGNSGTALPARWKPSSPTHQQRGQAARPSTRSLFTKLPQSSSQTASKQVRASLPACVQLVSGQKLLFQLLIGGQKSAKLGIFFFLKCFLVCVRYCVVCIWCELFYPQ